MSPFPAMRTLYLPTILLLSQMLWLTVHPAQSADDREKYRTVDWVELMPEEDLDALMNPPDTLADIADGSEEDQIANQLRGTIEKAGDSRYQQALVSTQIVPAFDNQAIRLPGFVVPLAFSGEQQRVTRFFLVPYFGACIHVPPPPPNQIVFAEHDEGFELKSIYDPVWISGVLRTTLVENDTATAAYAIEVEEIEPYTDE